MNLAASVLTLTLNFSVDSRYGDRAEFMLPIRFVYVLDAAEIWKGPEIRELEKLFELFSENIKSTHRIANKFSKQKKSSSLT